MVQIIKMNMLIVTAMNKVVMNELMKKTWKLIAYSGGMYPNVPTRRVCNEALPYSDSFVRPKSATCTEV